MRTGLLTISILILLGCSDSSIKAVNADPVAEITSHSDGQEVLEGYTESFRGLVSDPDHASEDLTALHRRELVYIHRRRTGHRPGR